MKVKFNFNLNAWITGVEVEAKSVDEALEKLYQMTAEELFEVGYIKESALSDVDGEITEKSLKVKVYDIEYDIEEDSYEDKEEFFELFNSLPNELVLDLTIDYEMKHKYGIDEEELIAEEITYKTGYEVKDFKYIILNTY